MPEIAEISARPGTYFLLLSSSTEAMIRVGQLGSLRLQPGFYVYVGSALGPGGVRARLAHHLRLAEHPRWHIDYLRSHMTPKEVWFCYDRKSLEHGWAHCFATMRGVSAPMAGFGSSDCDCKSHLFFFKKCPARANFARRLVSSSRMVTRLLVTRLLVTRLLVKSIPHPADFG
jgi:Uri superfamily endonuclease